MAVKAHYTSLPNIKKIFIPDRGYIICEADLSGADAQVVAWDANDEDLKAAFRAGLDVHAYNAESILGSEFSRLSLDDPQRYFLRQQYKQGVHAVNYLISVRGLALTLGWTVKRAEAFKRLWLEMHPAIEAWHGRIELELSSTRRISNAFGYSIPFFDRISRCLPKAMAWIPQSTVARASFKGGIAVWKRFPWVEFLMQVHDSLVFQIPLQRYVQLKVIKPVIEVTVPYDDPLIIPMGLAASRKSWGHCQEVDWDNLRLPSW